MASTSSWFNCCSSCRDTSKTEKGNAAPKETKLERGVIGIVFQQDSRSKHFIVEKVMPGTAASRADVCIGDILLKVDDIGVRTSKMLVGRIRGAAGTSLTLSLQQKDSPSIVKDVVIMREKALPGTESSSATPASIPGTPREASIVQCAPPPPPITSSRGAPEHVFMSPFPTDSSQPPDTAPLPSLKTVPPTSSEMAIIESSMEQISSHAHHVGGNPAEAMMRAPSYGVLECAAAALRARQGVIRTRDILESTDTQVNELLESSANVSGGLSLHASTTGDTAHTDFPPNTRAFEDWQHNTTCLSSTKSGEGFASSHGLQETVLHQSRTSSSTSLRCDYYVESVLSAEAQCSPVPPEFEATPIFRPVFPLTDFNTSRESSASPHSAATTAASSPPVQLEASCAKKTGFCQVGDAKLPTVTDENITTTCGRSGRASVGSAEVYVYRGLNDQAQDQIQRSTETSPDAFHLHHPHFRTGEWWNREEHTQNQIPSAARSFEMNSMGETLKSLADPYSDLLERHSLSSGTRDAEGKIASCEMLKSSGDQYSDLLERHSLFSGTRDAEEQIASLETSMSQDVEEDDDDISLGTCTCPNLTESERALHWAARYAHIPTISALAKAGVRLDATSYPQGKTALMRAARYGHADAALKLLQSGANVNLTDSTGKTALMWASKEGRLEAVNMLIKMAADLDKQTEVVAALVGGGADPNILNREGSTALEIALANARKMACKEDVVDALSA